MQKKTATHLSEFGDHFTEWERKSHCFEALDKLNQLKFNANEFAALTK